jgi:carbamoyl-phosphate synthase large subunit
MNDVVRTIAVTGMNARPDNPGPGYAVARCLRAAGYRGRIVALSYDALDPGLYAADVCDAAYLLPYPTSGDRALLERLRQIHHETSLDALIPCLDAELPGMVRLHPELEALGIRTFLPTAEQLRMRGKNRLADVARLGAIACPETRALTSAEFFRDAPDEGWDYPFIVKGLYYDARVARNAAEGAEAFRAIAAEWGVPVLAQRLIRGDEINLTAVGDGAGNLLGAVMMKKMAVTDKGKAWAGVSIVDDALLNASAAIVKALRWRGPLEVEVMRDNQGRYQLIEINPRFPAWIYLGVGVGRNLPFALLQLLRGAPVAAFDAPQPGVLFLRHAQEIIVPLHHFERMVTGGGMEFDSTVPTTSN